MNRGRVLTSGIALGIIIVQLPRRPSKGMRNPGILPGLLPYVRPIRRGVLEISQFPDVLFDNTGKIECPIEWAPTSVVTS